MNSEEFNYKLKRDKWFDRVVISSEKYNTIVLPLSEHLDKDTAIKQAKEFVESLQGLSEKE